ncbi:hypothetical protein CRG98_002331 [Punica granatum]|uniref:Uncharacterized protein n=1 Tax=Punica granatum TaxID=22663 RepID=A0A2I0L993_PUNGR|nr:hypothetical protein CRG98_002331 [Punica granatum]
MRGKSRGSVRESGDSVERLEECSSTRACTFGELGAQGVRLECTGGTRRAGRTSVQACSRAGVRAGGRARGQTCAGSEAGARLAHDWHYSPESDDSSPEMHYLT